jgi:hypothetical protein
VHRRPHFFFINARISFYRRPYFSSSLPALFFIAATTCIT